MTATAELTKHEPIEADRAPPENEVASIIRLAVEKNIDAEKLEKLFALYERDKARRAKEEFFADLARFQAECPAIKKTGKSTQFMRAARDGGGKEPSEFLELDYICDTIRPILHKHGFSYTWDKDTTQAKDGMISIVCHVRHRNGHVEDSCFPCPIGSNAGASDQQKYAAAATYAKRYSLIAALGITGTSRDTDGFLPEPVNGHEATRSGQVSLDGYITEEQALTIEQLLEAASTPKERLLKWLGAKSIQDIHGTEYPKVIQKLQATIKAREGSGA